MAPKKGKPRVPQASTSKSPQKEENDVLKDATNAEPEQADPELPTLSAHSPIPSFNISTYVYTPISTSPTPLIMSQDGQIVLHLKSEINILTPATGFQSDKPIVQSGTLSNMLTNAQTSKGKQRDQEDEGQPLPMFRTVLKIDKKDMIKWYTFVNENHVVTTASGTMDHYWYSATWSPSGLNDIGGCVLATLSNNNEVLIFGPQKNAHKSEWKETYDIASHLIKLIVLDEDKDSQEYKSRVPKFETALDRRKIAAKLWECQSTSIAWSSAVPGILGDFSILAVGHKSGHISLWRHAPDGTMSILHRYRVDTRASWITLLSWSPWMLSEASEDQSIATSLLAVTDSTGRVWVVEIAQTINSQGRPVPLTKDETNLDISEAVFATEPILVCDEKDRRSASQFEWIDNVTPPKLIYTKLGTVNFVELEISTALEPTSTFQLLSNIELELFPVGKWMGTTELSNCSGIVYLNEQNLVLLAIESGGFYLIALEPDPHFIIDQEEEEEYSASCSSLTRIARSIFLKTFTQTLVAKFKKQESIVTESTWKKGAKIHGISKMGNDGEIGWLYENVAPDRMNYKMSSFQRTLLVVAGLLGDVDGQKQLSRLEKILREPPNCLLSSPLAVLRSFLHYANDHVSDSEWVSSLLSQLSVSANESAPIVSTIDTLETRHCVASAIFNTLYSDTALDSLRYREQISRFLARHSGLSKSNTKRANEIQVELARSIGHQVITKLGNVLTAAQATLRPEELTISGQILLASASFPSSFSSDSSPDDLSHTFGGSETCPACSSPIPLTNTRSGVCGNGHTWERCSITLKIVESVVVRTCVGCERKALFAFEKEKNEEEQLPDLTKMETDDDDVDDVDDDSSLNDDDEKGINVIETLLKECKACLYCGGRWMRIR